jgi:predicted helicase
VFNIMVGTAITLAIADGSKDDGQLATVFYHDCWTDDLFTKNAKLTWLEEHSLDGDLEGWVPIDRGALDDFRPKPFQQEQWVSLTNCFQFFRSGIQTKRDFFAYSPSRMALVQRVEEFVSAEGRAAIELFSPTGARPYDVAQAHLADDPDIQLVAYRPLDRQWLCNERVAVDRPRPELQAAWGLENLCLYSLPGGTGAGAALWCHGLLPDYHAFRGSYGGYAFPLYDRRQGPDATNVSPTLIAGLSAAYGEAVEPQDVFDAILALLSASSYTRRFAEDLEDIFPHVAFPADHGVFLDAARIGAEIRQVETFERAPATRPAGFCRLERQPTGDVSPVDYQDGEIALCADGSGRITGIPQEVWSFAVSGYRVLPRWIEGRVGLPADLALIREFRDVAARIAELIHRFDEADLVLEATLANSLTREELGFADAEDEPVEEENVGD